MSRDINSKMACIALVMASWSMVAGPWLIGCRQRREVKARRCIPLAVKTATPYDNPVTRVEVYWDLSQSMRLLLFTKFRGGKLRDHSDSALRLAWGELDRNWVRGEEQGSLVNEVVHFGVGDEILPLGRVDRPPKLDAGYTNLPAFAMHTGKLLKENTERAFLLVSDMIVDTPKMKPGSPLCGKVLAPRGSGEVPTLFSRCMAEAWKGRAPDGYSIMGIVVRTPVPSVKKGRPLFFMLFVRNARYANKVGTRIISNLPANMMASMLSFAAAAPQVDCATMSYCGYWQTEDIIEAQGGAKRPCQFRALRKKGIHRVRCSLAPASQQARKSLILPTLNGVQAEGKGEVKLFKGAKVDTALKLDSWNDKNNVEVGYRLSTKWTLDVNMNDRLTKWLGPENYTNSVYRSLFISLLNSTVRSLSSPTCRVGWRLRYNH